MTKAPNNDADFARAYSAMAEELAAAAPAIFQPSEFWRHINARNIEQLKRARFSNFKRTINQNYFGWVPCTPFDIQFRSVLRAWITRPRPSVLVPRLVYDGSVEVGDERRDPFPTRLRLRGHAIYLALLCEYARRHDRLRLLDRLDEPFLGSPITIRYRNRQVSQDLCNSLLEFYAIMDALPAAAPRRILEVGSGYGRLAWLFLRARPSSRYILCDIPPALAVAQTYLETLFPDARVFSFRPFTDYADVADEFESAQICFVMPHQLDRMPPLDVDLFVNISSFHEMSPMQIERYFELIDRHCAGCFYSKQWLTSVNSHDGVVIRQDDYPVRSHWTQVFSRPHPVQRMFFEELYRVASADLS